MNDILAVHVVDCLAKLVDDDGDRFLSEYVALLRDSVEQLTTSNSETNWINHTYKDYFTVRGWTRSTPF